MCHLYWANEPSQAAEDEGGEHAQDYRDEAFVMRYVTLMHLAPSRAVTRRGRGPVSRAEAAAHLRPGLRRMLDVVLKP